MSGPGLEKNEKFGAGSGSGSQKVHISGPGPDSEKYRVRILVQVPDTSLHSRINIFLKNFSNYISLTYAVIFNCDYFFNWRVFLIYLYISM